MFLDSVNCIKMTKNGLKTQQKHIYEFTRGFWTKKIIALSTVGDLRITLLATGSRDVGKPRGGAPGARVFRTALKATNKFFFAQNPSVYSFGTY